MKVTYHTIHIISPCHIRQQIIYEMHSTINTYLAEMNIVSITLNPSLKKQGNASRAPLTK